MCNFEIAVLLLSSAWSAKGLLLDPDYVRNVTKTLLVHNGAKWGSWAHEQYCRPDTYAVGYVLKTESNQYKGDDTQLNGILLICEPLEEQQPPSRATSGVGDWGDWIRPTTCAGNPPNGTEAKTFLKSFKLKVEPDQGSGDDTAATNIWFHCQDFESASKPYSLSHHTNFFGNYGHWSDTCGANTAICGIQTKVQSSQGSGDDTALNDVRLFCCT